MPVNDWWIAATAIALGAHVVTQDPAYVELAGLDDVRIQPVLPLRDALGARPDRVGADRRQIWRLCLNSVALRSLSDLRATKVRVRLLGGHKSVTNP